MIGVLGIGIEFSMQGVCFTQSYLECGPHGGRFECIEEFKSLTFQLRAMWFHTFADKMTVYVYMNTRVYIYIYVYP